ncbi:MAG TPA: pyruvate:ferredoxin (flavodoxin) oxidoreductase [Thermotogota bacterium]|nr:pyruvate:ferredoxin (flavodoxin) oxidoreductase [Thermotogota bacterium]
MGKKMVTVDGNTAATHVAYAFSEVAAIYPITPSSPMGEFADAWAADGRKNVFGQKVKVSELQSEGGASGAVHGALQGGSLTTTFTASQGLLLMIPNMNKISGELLPAVFHVSARSVATHALSIFGDHSDVMHCRQTGWSLLASAGVQEAHDLAIVAHLAAMDSSVPFLHFFDGFRTSHEIQKVELFDYDDLAKLVNYDAVKAFKDKALRPEKPVTRGTAQNPDIFFQNRERANLYYDKVPFIVEEKMRMVEKLTGRKYRLFDYVGHPEADRIVVAMGSGLDTLEQTVEYLNAHGEKVGLIKVRLYRPFSVEHLLAVVPETVKSIAVLDRTKEPGSAGEPLYEDIKFAFYGQKNAPTIVGGRYGLSSKEFTPSMAKAVFDNLKGKQPKDHFTIGIKDDVSFTSLEVDEQIITESSEVKRCLFWGFGSDGTVGANKNSIKIIGDHTDMYAQGYFEYDSKKSGGVTRSHLRFGPKPIKSPYLVETADFIACHRQAYVNMFELVDGLKNGGIFLLNTNWNKEELEKELPNSLKRKLAQKNAKFFIIDGFKIAAEIGMGERINTIMQSAFFKLADIIPYEDAKGYMKKAIEKTYGKKGKDIVEMNYKAVDMGESYVEVPVPAEWAQLQVEKKPVDMDKTSFVREVADVMNAKLGDTLPVSMFSPDGTFENGTTAYEKRGVAVNIPKWDAENCIQCNQCVMVCPHAVIRPRLVTEEELKDAPETLKTITPMNPKLKEKYQFTLQISGLDCTGCGNCAQVCPGKGGNKALVMTPIEEVVEESMNNFRFTEELPDRNPLGDSMWNGAMFNRPLFEYHGACPGCGETPYVRLITQLFGERMVIANATGCSSIYGGSAPATPYCTNREGKGPAWANSLFEDNAEYGFGMSISINTTRDRLHDLMEQAIDAGIESGLVELFKEWIEKREDAEATKELDSKLRAALIAALPTVTGKMRCTLENILELKDYFVKKSVWIFGGDGWAYDIGYGGLDHVLASGEDINVLVMDTEVYSNTGGQASKATPTGAIAKFAAAGKPIRKKDLGMMATTYGYVYVAQISLGANMNQAFKAIKEAEAYKGPSLIIAYTPCINHGIKTGMGTTIAEEKKATSCGYWPIYRYDPRLADEGKNPFQLDGPKELDGKFQDFLDGEIRYSSLKQMFPERAEKLSKKAEEDMLFRYNKYKKLAQD